jgi:23S rRNA G2445 N2-methylase RlmL
MSLDHDAIRKAYPNVTRIDDSIGAFDGSGNKITLEQSKIDTARTELNTADTAVKYKGDRTGENETSDTIYPSIGDQLDLLYKDIVAGIVTASGGFATRIKATKDKYPKP